MWYMHEISGWWMVFGSIGMVIFWGGFIALAVWGIRRLFSENNVRQSPIDIAKERYARGEITDKQLEQLKKKL
ncbi:MAG: hypothetical protein A2Y89_06360 [Chloroflexi bacterium RBG_13_51_18]|nr:MAG: hypothetical protein A2Y89_06360 [Chloroflexi bacterium RBG_13_51_18]